MKVRVNGDDRVVMAGETVAGLVAELGRSPKGIAVAVNDEVVPRSEWASTALRADDRVEVLQAAQGGC